MKNEDIILAQTVKLKMIEMLKHSRCSDSFRYIMKHFEDESMTAVDIFEAVLDRLDCIESSLNYANEQLNYTHEQVKLADARYNALLSTYAEQLSLQPKPIVLEVKDKKMFDSILSLLKKKDS